jgi:hypothetical protein
MAAPAVVPLERIGFREAKCVFDSNCGGQKIVVVKVGGSVLTGVTAFRRVALFLKNRREAARHEQYVVVVSGLQLVFPTLCDLAQFCGDYFFPKSFDSRTPSNIRSHLTYWPPDN